MKIFLTTQKIYDWYRRHILGSGDAYAISEDLDESIYVTDGNNDELPTTDLQKKVYVGSEILGDAYDSKLPLSTIIPKSIGGIKQGTSIKTLFVNTRASVSQVIDKIICPVYAPCYHEPTCSLNASTDPIYIYALANKPLPTYPLINPGNIQTSCTRSSMIVHGVNPTDAEKTYFEACGGENSLRYTLDISTPIHGSAKSELNVDLTTSTSPVVLTDDLSIGSIHTPCKYTYTVAVLSAEGTDRVINSDGSVAYTYALNEDTLAEDADQDEYLTDDHRIGLTIGQQHTFEFFSAPPIFIDTEVDTTVQPSGIIGNYAPEQCYKVFDEGLEIELTKQNSTTLTLANICEYSLFMEDSCGKYSTVDLIPLMNNQVSADSNWVSFTFPQTFTALSAKYLLKGKAYNTAELSNAQTPPYPIA